MNDDIDWRNLTPSQQRAVYQVGAELEVLRAEHAAIQAEAIRCYGGPIGGDAAWDAVLNSWGARP